MKNKKKNPEPLKYFNDMADARRRRMAYGGSMLEGAEATESQESTSGKPPGFLARLFGKKGSASSKRPYTNKKHHSCWSGNCM